MPRFCANISLLFNEVALPERFEAAAQAGFRAVEIQFPYAYESELLAERARAAGVEVVLINMPAGDWEAGERGLGCLPGRAGEFREGVSAALAYAKALSCARINCLAGIEPEGVAAGLVSKTYLDNLRFAVGPLAAAGVELLIEPQNTRTFPGVHLRSTSQAIRLMDEVGTPNLTLQYDLFHMQIMEGDLARTLARLLSRIGHIQVADVPDRHEPGSGEIHYPFLFAEMDRLGYAGWVGAEYLPRTSTVAGLGWMKPYLDSTTPAAMPRHALMGTPG